MRARRLALGLLLAAIAGCATPSILQESRPEPALVLEEYFAGTTYAYGVFESRGRIAERFSMRMEGRPVPGGFTLYERFRHPDGFTWARTWTFRPRGGGVYDGTAETVVGTGRIEVLGDSIRMRFTADQPLRRGSIRLGFDQRLTRLEDDVVINRSTVSKFGVPFGRITMTFVKSGSTHSAAGTIPAA